MAINFKSQSYAGRTPEIWRGECKVLPAGFKTEQNFPVGTVITRGTLVAVDFDTLTCGVVKLGKVLDGSTTKNVRVAKGTLFAVGDTVGKVGDTATTTVASINTENVDYNVLVLTTAITGLTAGDALVEAKSGGGSKYTPNMVVAADREVKANDLLTIDAAYEAVVLYPSLAYAIPTDFVQGVALKNNPNIIFIKQ